MTQTHQQTQHLLRESERMRIASALESERNDIAHKLIDGVIFSTSTDEAGRKTVTRSDYQKALAQYRKLGELLAQMAESCDVAPETLRPPRPEYVDQAAPTVPCIPCDWDE